MLSDRRRLYFSAPTASEISSSQSPPWSVDAPFVELHDRHSTAVLAMSNGAPPAASGVTLIDSQVIRVVGGTLVARTPVADLAAPGTKDAGTQALPLPGAVQRVVPAAIGRSGVIRAPTTKAARNDAADRAQLHP